MSLSRIGGTIPTRSLSIIETLSGKDETQNSFSNIGIANETLDEFERKNGSQGTVPTMESSTFDATGLDLRQSKAVITNTPGSTTDIRKHAALREHVAPLKDVGRMYARSYSEVLARREILQAIPDESDTISDYEYPLVDLGFCEFYWSPRFARFMRNAFGVELKCRSKIGTPAYKRKPIYPPTKLGIILQQLASCCTESKLRAEMKYESWRYKRTEQRRFKDPVVLEMANELAQLRALRDEWNRRPTLINQSTSYHNSSPKVESALMSAAKASSTIMHPRLSQQESAQRFPPTESSVKLPEQFNQPRKRLDSLGFGQDVGLAMSHAAVGERFSQRRASVL